MRRKLILRFLVAYVLITICTRALSGSAWVILGELSTTRKGVSFSLWRLLRHWLTYLGWILTELLLPGTDMGTVAGIFISASILLAGAVLFARGPVKEYYNLCDKVRRLSAETVRSQVDEKGEPDIERLLDAVSARVASVEAALHVYRADCQAAKLLLDAACTQVEVVVEAGSVAEGSGEAKLVQDALAKIRQANAKIAPRF